MNKPTWHELNRIRNRAIEGRIVALHALDQGLVDVLTEVVRTQHAALREIYTELEIHQELENIVTTSKEEQRTR